MINAVATGGSQFGLFGKDRGHKKQKSRIKQHRPPQRALRSLPRRR